MPTCAFENRKAQDSRWWWTWLGPPSNSWELADSRTCDVILSDHRVSDWNGLNAFRWFRSSGYYTPPIVVTGTLGGELAIECIKAGVNDYGLKENLGPVAVRRAL